MPKIYFHVDVNSAFLSWSALKSLQDGGTVDLRTIPAVVGGDEAKRHGLTERDVYEATEYYRTPRGQKPQTKTIKNV